MTQTTDSAWDEYLASLDSVCMDATNSLEDSYRRAAELRDGYRRWLMRAIDKAENGIKDLNTFLAELEDGDPRTEDAEKELNRLELSIDFFIQETELLQSADDHGFNRWFARPQLDDLEYGIVAEENTLEVEADSFVHLMGMSEGDGPNLTWVREETFLQKADAQRFVDSIRKRFKSGDHSAEIIRTEVKKGVEKPYVAVVMEADGNWYHRNQLAALRDLHMANAIRKVEEATTARQLHELASIAKRYSRDMQVLNSGKSHDGGRVVNGKRVGRKVGIGFNYVRFAKVMNAIADRAKELGINGFRSYTINEFESDRKPADGDMLDTGCRQGEFLALEMEDERYTERSLWKEMEGYWKPSHECQMRLLKAGPTGFVPRTWKEILSFADSGRTLLAA